MRITKTVSSPTRYAPTVLDIFSGAGGIAYGFAQAGFRIVGGIDNNAQSINTFRRNIPQAEGCLRDLRKPDFSDIRDLVGPAGVDVVVGGPSCQGFSTSGGLSRSSGRDEKDPRNRLFINYLNLVDDLRPAWIVFENVPGLLLYNQGRVALDIVRAFREIGYSVAPMILLAADFGVPQLRRRLFFVGNRTGSDNSFPVATHGNPDLWRNFSLPFAHLSRIGHRSGEDVFPHVGFADACNDLPAVDEGGELDGVPYASEPKSDYQLLMRVGSDTVRQHAAADMSALDRLAAQTLLEGQNWRDMPAGSLPERFNRIRSYDATTILRRLKSDMPSYTVTTKFNEGTTGAFIHPTQPRTLSLREAARLQSFPDRFVFDGSQAQIRQQIGNAVPPLLAQAIAEAILPHVLNDTVGVSLAPIRDTVDVDNRLAESDILKLKAPRKIRVEEQMLMDAV
ncbi:MAG TPA: DNA cytosine methyltransferase [Aurantimonas coralicida]|uniref:DNA (cytosine-5-)-methyltransferase n=2 Tax=root TaxID=1 RepID=A0A9C9NE76_9HYPH|nr:DNA cytosine methyltransferase [Aurantimonas coralicida]HEU00202.1 DNA cytosine methyltransferase [Aurantimonas coralicida]